MSDLSSHFSPAVVEALERLVDERVAAVLAGRENGSEPTWLSIEESAAHVGVSQSTIARMLRQGRLHSSYVGRRRLILRADLDAL